MKNIKNILIQKALVVCALLLVGCQDYLEVAPESVWESNNFYSSEQEIEIALAGIYGVLAHDDSYGNDLYMLNTGTDEEYYNRRWDENWGSSLI
ncbi:hypothetical protein JCM19274_2764 [Algibacter lectus]|uniref:Outer membrane protein n=1 Tax=Algibacter lectus TaxID=221126 RepID=A0A090X0J5_9FLAO|nr:hypothetical protein [Algibacter lectus]GAL82053.1 hypothetical protein JCM19274_2764 [Algibacter lectus]